MSLEGDKYRFNNWIKYYTHEVSLARLEIRDIENIIDGNPDSEILLGGIRYLEYKVSQYIVLIDDFRRKLALAEEEN